MYEVFSYGVLYMKKVGTKYGKIKQSRFEHTRRRATIDIMDKIGQARDLINHNRENNMNAMTSPERTTAILLPRVGEVFPDYISFCKAMGENPVTGNAKIAQVKRWKSQMKIVTIGRTWRILEIYGKEEMMRMEAEEREKKKTEGFLGLNPRVVMNQRKFLLMLKIKESLKASREIPEDSTSSDGYYAVFDFKEMDSFLGLVNNRFQDDKDYEEGLDDFYTVVRNKNKEVTLSLCHSLISSGFVEGYKSYFVTMESGEDQVIPFQLLKDITDLELNVFEALGVRSKQEIHNKGLWRDFNEKRKEYLKMKFQIVSIRSCFVFSTTERICDWFLENNVREFASRGNLRMEINSVNVEKLEKHMEQVYQRNLIKPKTILEESIVPQLKTWDEGKFDNVRDEEGRCLTEIANVRVAVPLPDNFVEKQKEFIAKRVNLKGEMR